MEKKLMEALAAKMHLTQPVPDKRDPAAWAMWQLDSRGRTVSHFPMIFKVCGRKVTIIRDGEKLKPVNLAELRALVA